MKKILIKIAPVFLGIAALVYFWFQGKYSAESSTLVYLGNGVSIEHDGGLVYKNVTDLITMLPVLGPPDDEIQVNGKAGKPWKLIVDPVWIRKRQREPSDEKEVFRPPTSTKAGAYRYLTAIVKIEKGYPDNNPFEVFVDGKQVPVKEKADLRGKSVFAFDEPAEVNRIELLFPPSDEVRVTVNKLWLHEKGMNIFETLTNLF